MKNYRLNSPEVFYGYKFRDRTLLQQALTHSSTGEPDHQTLEFLGDAVLNLVASAYLFKTNTETTEGELTKKRSQIVNNRNSLSAIAEHLNLSQYIRVGKAFPKSDKRAWQNLQSDVLEAVMGAMYLDGGLEAVENFFYSHYLPAMSHSRSQNRRNYKSLLQEHLQGLSKPTPVYKTTEVRGEDHSPHFTVACLVKGLNAPGIGEGRTIKEAEQSAASKAYDLLSR